MWEVEMVGNPGTSRTDNPRQLTADEERIIWQSGRLDAIKLHRQWTNSTLGAAVRCVDAIRGEPYR